jgi:IS5 family transposase
MHAAGMNASDLHADARYECDRDAGHPTRGAIDEVQDHLQRRRGQPRRVRERVRVGKESCTVRHTDGFRTAAGCDSGVLTVQATC